MQFADKLKSLMENNKITGYALAKQIGISRSTISNWINDGKKPNSNYIRQVADYFGVTPECLIDDNYDNVVYTTSAQQLSDELSKIGLDSDLYRTSTALCFTCIDSASETINVSADEKKIISIYRELDADSRIILMGEALKLKTALDEKNVEQQSKFKKA
jgi:transcriptional regulator with XRE-family HTH domain